MFDGVHRGHRALVERVRARASTMRTSSGVIGFDPYPGAVLAPAAPTPRLTDRRRQTRLLCELGVDWVWFIPFSPRVAQLSPSEFLRFLLSTLRLQELWVGYDFRFGRDRAGDIEFLRRDGPAQGLRVEQFPAVEEGGRPISSTRIRESLRSGEVEEATKLLGHTFVLEGAVRPGRGAGTRLLVPTANVRLEPSVCLPDRGVYAAWAEVGGELHPAVSNLGVRPTLTDDTAETLEVHLLDWSGDLSGAELGVHLVSRLRPERRFEGIQALQAAIADDIERTRGVLARGGVPPFSPAL